MIFNRIFFTLKIVSSACLFAGCVLSRSSRVIPQQTPVGLTSTTTSIAIAISPSITPTNTSESSIPSLTPTTTKSPTTQSTSTSAPAPSGTPYQGVTFRNDQMQVLDVQQISRIDLSTPHVILLNINNRSNSRSLATALPDSEIAVLYFVNARNPNRLIKAQELHASALGNIFPSRDGNSFVYLETTLAGTTSVFVLSLDEGFRLRVLTLLEEAPYGIPVIPSWSPDGGQFVVAIPSENDMDIFNFELVNNQWRAITLGSGFDFHPVWSPDGRYIAFLSDSSQCVDMSRTEDVACKLPDVHIPRQGQLHLYDIVTDEISRVSDAWISNPPVWLNSEKISFISQTKENNVVDRILWTADIRSGDIQQLVPNTNNEFSDFQNVFWSEDGNSLVLQISDEENKIILLNTDGTLIGSTDEYSFPRYGISVSWAPDRSRIAIGGVEGQCPYGALIFSNGLELISQGTIPPMCESKYAPDSSFLAFEGVNSRLDGRIHVYLSSRNGYGAVNLTSNLRGQNRLIGWAMEQ